MSSANRIANVGASARASDFQAVADIASAADDRAMEILVTPGAAQKKIVPLSEESLTVNPRLLIVGKDTDATLANGKVRVRPAHFVAGVLSDPNAIGLAGKLDALLDSAVFANNSSGSTRTDLLYATLSYGAAVTASVRQKPTAGGAPVSTTLTIENDITITLGVVAGVASGSPLASLPADSGSGKTAVYNFGLAAVSVANGFSGGAINQASITALWNGGWIQPHRVHGRRLMSLYAGSAVEKPSSALTAMTPGMERWGADNRFFVHLKNMPSTPTNLSVGDILDNSIDWRHRIISGYGFYMGSASQLPLESAGVILAGATGAFGLIQPGFTGPGQSATSAIILFPYGASTNIIEFQVDLSGVLRVVRNNTAPIDNTNGDLIALWIEATDQFLPQM